MTDLALHLHVRQRTARAALWSRLAEDERGEGVISTAIAVLVMAFLGVLMWQLFSATLVDSNTNVNDKLNEIK
ncbi:MAG TPA: hypothetical protein VM242_07420 [Acidimicrobiales bacterium]|jgi:ABC-type polysaccharide/polyol phosphate export permease|nr:hypothetical protein [Acidimicrobiales bacterium]